MSISFNSFSFYDSTGLPLNAGSTDLLFWSTFLGYGALDFLTGSYNSIDFIIFGYGALKSFNGHIYSGLVLILDLGSAFFESGSPLGPS